MEDEIFGIMVSGALRWNLNISCYMLYDILHNIHFCVQNRALHRVKRIISRSGLFNAGEINC